MSVLPSNVTVGKSNENHSGTELPDGTPCTFSSFPIVASYSPRVTLELVAGYTVTGVYSDPDKPNFIFVEVKVPLSVAQNFTRIAFSYDSSIIYTIDSVGRHYDSNKSDQVIFKLPLPENSDENYIYSNIVGSNVIM